MEEEDVTSVSSFSVGRVGRAKWAASLIYEYPASDKFALFEA